MGFSLGHELASHGATAVLLTPVGCDPRAMLETYGVAESNGRRNRARGWILDLGESSFRSGCRGARARRERLALERQSLSSGQLARSYDSPTSRQQPDAWST